MRGPFGYAIRHFSILLRNHKTLDVMLSRIPLPLLEGRILGQAFFVLSFGILSGRENFSRPKLPTSNAQRPTSNVGAAAVQRWGVSSLLKKPPGEGTGPTTHADSRGLDVGRVPSRGEHDVFERAARILEFRNVLQRSQVLNRQWTRIHAKD